MTWHDGQPLTANDFVFASRVYSATLDPAERNRQIVQMAKVVGDDVPGFWVYFDYQAKARLAALSGPLDAPILSTGSAWNIHAWELG